ncbi:uncharacterized protein [Solanum lycopersicum]|uniref:Uncharacterized protein n=1 Tax=Solanum lycopersicum TaxID=4081 RepID=A0A3Q7FT41_SOLLC|nr:uncharacterized protein LOC101261799 [Solanum lycopersicum]
MLLMDGEKKRKRTSIVAGDRSNDDVKPTVKEEEPPSEAEVNEFFAILRRMHMAVKYLQRNAQIQPENVNAHGSKLTASPAGVNGDATGQKRERGIVRKGDLDLNTLPDCGD